MAISDVLNCRSPQADESKIIAANALRTAQAKLEILDYCTGTQLRIVPGE
ncbi:hypothetical protein [Microbulbifer pacificus]|uniref:Uncharacterized protein n=1 Tax=Microbulbifer pacificus TaxID=407164 RepID=A0AAU0MVS8_9GAMM|nr:hypothetical protein [Microbulbifer pacificus]WOX04001.1 hypothetical protein R5R33_09630 [Microbulbifer pacificus]